MATGFEFLFKALGIDKDKVEAAIAGIGQISVSVKNDIDEIKRQNAEILEMLRNAGYQRNDDAAGRGNGIAQIGSRGSLSGHEQRGIDATVADTGGEG